MPYVIIVNNDNSLYGSQKRRIMQREKLFNELWILVPQYYNGFDMAKCTVTMRYLVPISKELKTETLIMSQEMYEDCLKYVLPVDTDLTKEFGELELNLTFTMLSTDDYGGIIQHVRKTGNHVLNITRLPDWDSIVPDNALSALDQRILKQDAQIEALKDLANVIESNKADNIVYDKIKETLQLSSNGVGIGNKVSVRDMLDDGIPVIDLNNTSGDSADTDVDSDNNCDCGCDCNDNDNDNVNVVEF